MKRILLLVFTLAAFQANAQVVAIVDLIRLMFTWQEGGYEMKLTTFNGEPAFLHGVRGGWYVHEGEKTDVVMGIGMYGASTSLNEQRLSTQENLFTFYTTLYCGVRLKHKGPIDFEFPAHIGYGTVYMEKAYVSYGGTDSRAGGYFIAEPNANALLKLGKSVRFGVGCGYRIIGGIRINGTDNIGMSGLTLNATLRFGRYD
ncbi:MAG: hypothetical protein ACOZCO_15550 [Bacteroidota bacterium]